MDTRETLSWMSPLFDFFFFLRAIYEFPAICWNGSPLIFNHAKRVSHRRKGWLFNNNAHLGIKFIHWMDFHHNHNTEFFSCDCFQTCLAFHKEMILLSHAQQLGSFGQHYHQSLFFLGFDFFSRANTIDMMILKQLSVLKLIRLWNHFTWAVSSY